MVVRFFSMLSRSTAEVVRIKRIFSCLSIAVLFLCFFSLLVAASAFAQETKLEDQPKTNIDLSLIGFKGLSASARLSTQANMSVDFVDNHHVLVTFNPKKIFARLPDCPPSHDDRIIHAAILEMPSGKVVKEADWYLHDHQRYLWALGSGRLLLRRLNSLYLLDSGLREKLLLTSPKPFLWITATPDGKQIIVERRQDDATGKTSKAQNKPVKPKVQIEFLDTENLSVQRVVKAEGIVNLEALSTGFADVIHGLSGKVWLVRFGPSGSQRENITRVRSRCMPDVIFSSSNTLLVGRCAMESSDYSVSSFTVTGHFLWRQHWSQHRYTPRIQRSEDGSRIAVSSLARVMDPVVPAEQSGEDGDDTDLGLQQRIQVLDTASGTENLSLTVIPAALSVQNVSLSPDGQTLALLRGTTLEVYPLPEMSQEDRAKYLAARADVPGLYAPASQLPTGAAPEETTFASMDAAEEAARQEQVAADDAAKAKEDATSEATKPAAAPVAMAQPENSGEAPITFRSATRIVVEEVVVTDSKGHPVKGLHQQDFQLAEDGRAQNVRSFEEFPNVAEEKAVERDSATSVASAPAKESAPPPPPPKLPDNVYTNNTSTGPETGSATIVVLDLLNTPLPDQQRAREQLISFIKKRPEASQMALCSLSTNLRLIQGFTRDENALIGAVNGKKGGVKAPSWQSDAGLERSVQMAREVALVAGDGQSIIALQRAQSVLDEENAHDIDVRMRFTLDALTQLARYLSGIPGRKNLVWLSGSFPLNIFPNPDVNQFEPVTRNYEISIKKATNLLAEAHVAVYPVNVKGVETQPLLTASNNVPYEAAAFAGSQGPPHPGAGALANTVATLPLSSSTDRQMRAFRETVASEHGTMDQIATETGGKAFYSNGIEDAIKTAVEEGSHYYTLSYTPTNRKYDGAFRKIKVSLEEKGYHLAYRRGYYAEDPDAGARDTRDPAQRVGVAAMQQGSPQSRQIVFATRVVPLGKPRKVENAQAGTAATKKKKGAPAGPVEMQHYGIDYAVDASDMRFGAMTAGTYHAVLSFMVTAFNDDGRLVASLVSTATSDLKPANYKEVMTGGFRIHQELDVPVEAVSLRLGVEDAASSHVGTLEIPLPVPVPPDAPLVATRQLPPVEPD